ncbi:fatty acid desaturase [Synechococcus sp. CS-1327]|uniref:fatty acid desaturase family protein n=1 Tax=Synechococcus sp. CS-1327 TaxID=2847977 RepID=UPI00223B3F64|nr:fatty acid desaturase [Synechococcus sp. CS-1327]MCT0232928.1 fatty acid desaturase [Synechococcus sp. CS-1327]
MGRGAELQGSSLHQLEIDLCEAVADLTAVVPLLGLLRVATFGGLLIGGIWMFWSAANPWQAIGSVTVAGIAYALLLITTHEAVHGTLLGRPRLEFAFSCLISWPMAWPFATYASLHRLHHRWNGRDERDPERVEPLREEIEQAGPLRRWHQRHPFWLRALLLGGVGLIIDTVHKGVVLRGCDPRLPARLRLDLAGVILAQLAMLGVAIAHGVVLRYVLFWLVVERIIGAIVQTRGLIEHHGLWNPSPGHRLTQLRSSRSVGAGIWLNACLGGLPNHAAHHAFPAIPFQQLPEASVRLMAVLELHGLEPLPRFRHYGEGILQLL